MNQLKEAQDSYKKACQKPKIPGVNDTVKVRLAKKVKNCKKVKSPKGAMNSPSSAVPNSPQSGHSTPTSTPKSPLRRDSGTSSRFPFDQESLTSRVSIQEECDVELLEEAAECGAVVKKPARRTVSGDSTCSATGAAPDKTHHRRSASLKQNLSSIDASSSDHQRKSRRGAADADSVEATIASSEQLSLLRTQSLVSPPRSPLSVAAAAQAARARRLATLKAIHEKSQSIDSVYIWHPKYKPHVVILVH